MRKKVIKKSQYSKSNKNYVKEIIKYLEKNHENLIVPQKSWKNIGGRKKVKSKLRKVVKMSQYVICNMQYAIAFFIEKSHDSTVWQTKP